MTIVNNNEVNEEKKQKKRKIILLLVLILLVALCLTSILIWQGLKKPEMSKTQESPILTQVTGTYKPGKDLYLQSVGGDISVSIPACAIDRKGKIILTPLGQYADDQALPDQIWTRLRTADVSFYDRSGKLFERMAVSCAVQVCFTLTDQEWSHYSRTSTDFEIQYLDYDFTPPAWASLPSVSNSVTHKLCTENDRLGLFALAIKNSTPAQPGGPYDPLQPLTTPTQSGPYEPIIH